MTVSQIASKEGLNFEKKLYNTINEHFDGFTIRQEKDIKKEYGDDTSGIDMEIFNKSSTDIKDNKHIFIQLKWKCKPDSIKNINHFIHGCNQIIKQKKLDDKSILHIYGTKVPISKPSLGALNKLNMSENITYDHMDTCILSITNRCLEFFNKKEIESNNLINIPQVIPKVNNKIITMIINNKEYRLTYFYEINIYRDKKYKGNHDNTKTDEDMIKEAIKNDRCLITKAGPKAQWYLKCFNKDIDDVKQKLLEPFNGYSPKGLYNILIELII